MNSKLRSKLLSTRFEIGSQLGQHPLLFSWWRRLFMPGTQHLLVSDETEIVIEGFPRSGNTFSVAAFTIAQNRSVTIARHTHRPAQVITAVQKNLPTLILIRRPLDAILSLVIRHPYISMQQGFRSYISFYQGIQPYKNSFVIAEFDDIISDFGQIIDLLNQKFGTSFIRFEHNDQNVEKCFRLVEEMNRNYMGQENVVETAVARPSKQRNRMKNQLINELVNDRKASTLLSRAETQYIQFVQDDLYKIQKNTENKKA